AEYRRNVGPHTVGILGGVERQTADSEYVSAFRKNYVTDQIDQINAGGDAEKNNSGSAFVAARQNYFTRLNYAFQDKYLLEFVARYDGSYIFPADQRFGFFPGVSAGWRISEEPFFRKHVPLFDDLKLRASWEHRGGRQPGLRRLDHLASATRRRRLLRGHIQRRVRPEQDPVLGRDSRSAAVAAVHGLPDEHRSVLQGDRRVQGPGGGRRV